MLKANSVFIGVFRIMKMLQIMLRKFTLFATIKHLFIKVLFLLSSWIMVFHIARDPRLTSSTWLYLLRYLNIYVEFLRKLWLILLESEFWSAAASDAVDIFETSSIELISNFLNEIAKKAQKKTEQKSMKEK
jgi:hypothetical protein